MNNPNNEFPNRSPLNPLVSICIQTYNHAPYIAQCIEGALMQETDFPYEIIIGEDESTDGTRDICIEYAKKYPEKIRLFLRREEDKIWVNGVKTGRFNLVENLKAARGKYIALCEGDDYWVDKEKIKNQVSILERNEKYVITATDTLVLDENTNQIQGRLYNYQDSRVFSRQDFLINNRIPTLTVMFRNIKLNFPHWFLEIPYGDWPLYFLLSQHGDVYFENSVTAIYRKHDNGIWTTLRNNEKIKIKNKIRILSEFLKSTTNQQEARIINSELARIFLSIFKQEKKLSQLVGFLWHGGRSRIRKI